MSKAAKNKFEAKISICLFIAVIFFFLAKSQALAASYNIYVDKGYDGEEDGSSEKPYTTIEKAISESGSKGKKIYVRNGEYKETLTLEKGIEIYGQDKNKTIIQISGLTMTAKDSNVLENLTVSGGNSGITAQGKISIKNCIVTKASGNGLTLSESSSQATIEKSEFFDNRKGIYVQARRKISIVENYIHGNGGEGLDIRQKVRGTVSGNDIVGNSEGGVELIIGSANLSITNNKIQKNKSCGIANQFYTDFDRTGKVNLSKNTISRNGKYGICCLAPSGGKGLKSGYWNESISVVGNKIEDNKMKAIAGACKIMEAVSEEEEKANEVKEDPEAEKNSEEEEKPAENTEEKSENNTEENSIVEENEKAVSELVLQINLEKETISSLIDQKKQELYKNRFKTFFIGQDTGKISALREENKKMQEKIPLIQEALKRIDSDSMTSEGQKLIDEINAKISETESFAQEKEKTFSLFGWLIKYFKS